MKINKSIIAQNGSTITKSKIQSQDNSYIVKKIRTEAFFISFIVGFISSLIASYVFSLLTK